jgi:crotonobetainyl-CoA:carnitine CoA-transferase CaiB-like acyl-CoA transferase
MGPWATHILAGYGADVIKVEPPGGDIIRTAGTGRHPLMGPVFMQQSRGKRSVVLDLKTDAGHAALLKLLTGADVVMHNVRRAAIERLGLTYAEVAAVNARAIYVALVGYAQHGPYADRPAYDDLIQGISGLASLFVPSGGSEPRYVPALIADRVTGMNAAIATLAALHERTRTGKGSAVEVSMFETLVELVLADHFGGRMFDPPAGEFGYRRVLAPNRKPYRTRDGHVCLLVYNEAQWERFFAAIGALERFRGDARLCDPAIRGAHYDEAYGVIAEILAAEPTQHWLNVLGAADVPIVPLNDLESLLADPHLAATEFFGRQTHPTEGPLVTLGRSARFGGGPWPELGPAPRLGEHTAEVLREAGCGAAQIEALLAAQGDGVPGPAKPY